MKLIDDKHFCDVGTAIELTDGPETEETSRFILMFDKINVLTLIASKIGLELESHINDLVIVKMMTD